MSSIPFYTVNSSSNTDVCRVQRTGQGQKMAQALAFEKVDKHGNPEKCYLASTSRKPHKAKRQRIDTGAVVTLGSSDEGNHDFEGPEGSESDSESDGDSVDVPLSNAEVSCLVNLLLNHGLNYVLFMVGCQHSPFQDHSIHRAWCLCKAHHHG